MKLLTCRQEFSNNSKLPLVIAALNPNGETYLVAGFAPYQSSGKREKKWVFGSQKGPPLTRSTSPFGLAFQECCQRTGARAKHDAFDTHVMEVKTEDLQMVIEELQKMDL